MNRGRRIIDKFPLIFEGMIIGLLFVLNAPLFLSLAVIAILVLASKNFSDKWWICFLVFVIAFMNRIIAAYIIDTPIRSDFQVYYESAQMFAEHKSYLNLHWDGEINNYWSVMGYNNGIVIFYGLLLRIWDHPFFLKTVNSLLEAGTCVLIYSVSKRIFSDKQGAVFAALLYAFCPFSVLYITVLSNQQSSLFFLMLGLAVIFCNEKKSLLHFLRGG